ncbi:MAG: YihY/virulence factor BrkB family protein, partial [Bacteroidales bacterium]|nr:YihY/virulence factor BrkB family protein [Bacteroidales bacterium]
SLLGWAIFGATIVMVFSAMFKFIPSVHVKYKYALRAAILSGIAFTVLQYLYLETQLLVTRINAVYGTVAAIPLFRLWLRFGWLISVFGAQFSYSFQTIGEEDAPSDYPLEAKEMS